MPEKKPFLSYHDLDQSSSSVCPPLSIASAEGATVLRRSLRKVIEESKKDAASSSVSNSRESTPPRTSGSGRRISTRQAFSPASSSQPASLSKNVTERIGSRLHMGITSTETTGFAKQLDFRRRSARVRKVKRNIDDDVTKMVPSVSSDDDTSSVKESSRVCDSVSDLSMIANVSRLSSRVDTSDTDSRASSLCAYSTRSATSGQASAARLSTHIGATAKPKNSERSRLLKHVTDELSKLESSDSETDGQTNTSQTPLFDSFPDNSNSGSSICSSVPAPEPPADRSVDKCKNGVSGSSQVKESSAVTLDPDEAGLKENTELETGEESWQGPESKAKSGLNVVRENVPANVREIQSSSEHKVASLPNENVDDDELEDSSVQKGQSSGENSSAPSVAEEKIALTEQEMDRDDVKVKACIDSDPLVKDRTACEESKADGFSTMVPCDDSAEQDTSGKIKEEVDDMSNVQEEPPEILVSLVHFLQLHSIY